jgi:hypothetical protein
MLAVLHSLGMFIDLNLHRNGLMRCNTNVAMAPFLLLAKLM